MNKSFAGPALAAGLMLATFASPSARADAIGSPSKTIQSLPMQSLSASMFDSLFKPIDNAPVISSPYQFLGAPVSGTVRSQVFEGMGDAAGKYAYAYQFGVNDVENIYGEKVFVDGASWQFNATPVGTDFNNTGSMAYAYDITDGSIGGLVPPKAGEGQTILPPSSLSWQAGKNIGRLLADYTDPAADAPPLGAGADSATLVVVTDQNPFTTQYVSLLSSNPTTGSPAPVYAADGGSIEPIPNPIPEPSTVLAWGGMIGALALVRKVRKARNA